MSPKKSDKGKDDFLDITNQDAPDKSSYDNPDPRMPQHPARVLVCGESGSGKTNLVINILKNNWMSYNKLVLCVKNPESWQHFIDLSIEKLTDADVDPDDYISLIEEITSPSDIPTIESLPGGKVQTIVVFDDLVMEGKPINDAIARYWVRSRHRNVSPFYLTQDFYKTNKTIRQNSTYYILFGGMTRRMLRTLFEDVAPGIEAEEFFHLYHIATNEPHTFLFIDKLNANPLKRFRKNFDAIIF
jgi:hypothetical protein